MGCPWTGELRHLERHISPSEEGDCPLVEVSCKHGCGQTMKRKDHQEHEEDICLKRPVEFQLSRLQSRMEKMFLSLEEAHKAEIDELKNRLDAQEKQMAEMKKELDKLKKANEQFMTTIPVFSPSVLCIMPKLPSGNIPGVSYYPVDRYVKITGSCKQELEARTHQFLAEYEKILPRLSKERFEANENFPMDSVELLVDSCNKKFSACYASVIEGKANPSIELVSTNASQFEMAKKLISEKMKQRVFRMRFPGDMPQTLTLKCGSIKEEEVDVIVLFVVGEPPVASSPGSSLSSFLRLSSGETDSVNSTSVSVPPGKALLKQEPMYNAKNVIYISSLSPHSRRGYFGKEAYSQISESLQEALKEAMEIEARSIAFPCEVSSGGMQSNYIIPAVIQGVSSVMGPDKRNAEESDCSLSDIRIIVQDDKLDNEQFSSYFKYLAAKYHLQ